MSVGRSIRRDYARRRAPTGAACRARADQADAARAPGDAARPQPFRADPPHAGLADGEQATGAGKSGTLRAAIFGVNDGLVSNAALIMGFAGANQTRSVILLAGISGLLAGGVLDGCGRIRLDAGAARGARAHAASGAHEIGSDPEEASVSSPASTRGRASHRIWRTGWRRRSRTTRRSRSTRMRVRLGIDPTEGLGSPVGAGVSSFITFSIAVIP